ncbi:hypothetical protein [Chryseobacterium taklimakanense]|nr:hypothetical protein [Chryseobacterium taklimakanense]
MNEIKCRVFDENFEDRYIAKVIQIEDFYFAIIEENHKINYKIPKNNIF